MYAYHVVTDRPLKVGQQIIFDDPPIVEMLVDGHIKVVEMIKEINANIK